MDNDYSAPAPTAWVGWIAFAGLMMIVVGVLGAISGLAAIVRDETYVQGISGERVWVFDETAWGWIHLLIGIGVVAIGAMMLRGGVVGMALGAGVIVLHMIAHFNTLGIYPWWSIVVIAIDVLILYALIVHGGEMAT